VEAKDKFRVSDPNNDGVIDLLVTQSGKPPLALDVTVTSSIAICAERGERSLPRGKQMALAALRKINKYRQPCLDSGMEFMPVVFYTQGNMSPETIKFIRTAAAAKHPESVTYQAAIVRYWTRRIGIELVMGVARAQRERVILNNLANGWDGHAHTTATVAPGSRDECYREGTIENVGRIRACTFNLSGGGRTGYAVDRGGGGAAGAAGSGAQA
jgi:hypothetical protein